MRELADELKDDGDEGAGRRDREKKLRKKEKKLRKKEEREKPERERENRKCIFNWRGKRIVIKKYFFFLPVSYSAHLKIDVHCS